MTGPKKFLDEKRVHVAFALSLFFKAVFAISEIVAGFLTYLVTQRFLLEFVQAITLAELTEDPRDFIANHLLRAVQHLSLSGRKFAAIYLVSHGVIKLWLIFGLWRKKLRYYPAAILVFGFFIVYQVYRFRFTHSILLLLVTAVDFLVIALTWVEYRNLRRTAPKNPG